MDMARVLRFVYDSCAVLQSCVFFRDKRFGPSSSVVAQVAAQQSSGVGQLQWRRVSLASLDYIHWLQELQDW